MKSSHGVFALSDNMLTSVYFGNATNVNNFGLINCLIRFINGIMYKPTLSRIKKNAWLLSHTCSKSIQQNNEKTFPEIPATDSRWLPAQFSKMFQELITSQWLTCVVDTHGTHLSACH